MGGSPNSSPRATHIRVLVPEKVHVEDEYIRDSRAHAESFILGIDPDCLLPLWKIGSKFHDVSLEIRSLANKIQRKLDAMEAAILIFKTAIVENSPLTLSNRHDCKDSLALIHATCNRFQKQTFQCHLNIADKIVYRRRELQKVFQVGQLWYKRVLLEVTKAGTVVADHGHDQVYSYATERMRLYQQKHGVIVEFVDNAIGTLQEILGVVLAIKCRIEKQLQALRGLYAELTGDRDQLYLNSLRYLTVAMAVPP